VFDLCKKDLEQKHAILKGMAEALEGYDKQTSKCREFNS